MGFLHRTFWVLLHRKWHSSWCRRAKTSDSTQCVWSRNLSTDSQPCGPRQTYRQGIRCARETGQRSLPTTTVHHRPTQRFSHSYSQARRRIDQWFRRWATQALGKLWFWSNAERYVTRSLGLWLQWPTPSIQAPRWDWAHIRQSISIANAVEAAERGTKQIDPKPFINHPRLKWSLHATNTRGNRNSRSPPPHPPAREALTSGMQI